MKIGRYSGKVKRGHVWIGVIVLFIVFAVAHYPADALLPIFSMAGYEIISRHRRKVRQRQAGAAEYVRQEHALREAQISYWNERATREAAAGVFPSGERYSRQIPQDVKIAVAVRDGNQCRQCGSTENLEYDHVIPYSRGGTSSVHNVQLLCFRCNRSKGVRLT